MNNTSSTLKKNSREPRHRHVNKNTWHEMVRRGGHRWSGGSEKRELSGGVHFCRFSRLINQLFFSFSFSFSFSLCFPKDTFFFYFLLRNGNIYIYSTSFYFLLFPFLIQQYIPNVVLFHIISIVKLALIIVVDYEIFVIY